MNPKLFAEYLRIVRDNKLNKVHIETTEWKLTIDGVFYSSEVQEETEEVKDPLEGLRRG